MLDSSTYSFCRGAQRSLAPERGPSCRAASPPRGLLVVGARGAATHGAVPTQSALLPSRPCGGLREPSPGSPSLASSFTFSPRQKHKQDAEDGEGSSPARGSSFKLKSPADWVQRASPKANKANGVVRS